MKQLEMLPKQQAAYGGDLMKRRKGRLHGRPLSVRNSMHLVLRSSKAKGAWSFRRPSNQRTISMILKKFSQRHGVRILSSANVGNHLHLQIQLGARASYRPFIRAITSAIAMAVSGRNRWTMSDTPIEHLKSSTALENTITKNKWKFWDYRPFTRIVTSFRALLNLRDYIEINRFEGWGYTRDQARFVIGWERAAPG